MGRTMADRLASARQRAFVGRERELRIFAGMLDGAEPATVLHVHGPGGVGKSALLQRMGWLAESRGHPVTRVDGREFDATTAATGSGGVLLLDEIDALPGRPPDALAGVLSRLPSDTVAVLAGRVRVLAADEFAVAVRDALRDVGRPDRLRTNALTGSRLVSARVGGDATPLDRARALAAAIQDAAGVLERSPRDRRGFRALHHTYLQPAPTQAAAAELLDLPTTTYRRHLTAGVGRLTELLWQEELGHG